MPADCCFSHRFFNHLTYHVLTVFKLLLKMISVLESIYALYHTHSILYSSSRLYIGFRDMLVLCLFVDFPDSEFFKHINQK